MALGGIERRPAMEMYIGGEWVDRGDKIPVVNPYDGSVFDTVPRASVEDVEASVASAVRGAEVMAEVPAYRRYEMLHRAADLLEERTEDLARTITMEEGKIIGEARTEVGRAVQTIGLSAEEAKRLYGETVPLGRCAYVDGSDGVHAAGARRSCGGHQSVQLPSEPRVSQGWAGAGRRQLGDNQAGVGHASLGPQAHRDTPRGGRAS